MVQVPAHLHFTPFQFQIGAIKRGWEYEDRTDAEMGFNSKLVRLINTAVFIVVRVDLNNRVEDRRVR